MTSFLFVGALLPVCLLASFTARNSSVVEVRNHIVLQLSSASVLGFCKSSTERLYGTVKKINCESFRELTHSGSSTLALAFTPSFSRTIYLSARNNHFVYGVSTGSDASSRYFSSLRFPEKKANRLRRTVLYSKFKFNRAWHTHSVTRKTGQTHVHELNRERRYLSEFTRDPITIGANVLYIYNVDKRISNSDLEAFFDHFYGHGSTSVRLKRQLDESSIDIDNCADDSYSTKSKIDVSYLRRSKFLPAHKKRRLKENIRKMLPATSYKHLGHGFVFFETTSKATQALLKYNGVKLGDRNILLMEAYNQRYLRRRRGTAAVVKAAREVNDERRNAGTILGRSHSADGRRNHYENDV